MATIPTPTPASYMGALGHNLWNHSVRDTVNFLLGGSVGAAGVLGAKPTMAAHTSASQAYTTAVEARVVFQTIDRDTDGAYNASTGVFTCVTPGLYVFVANIAWPSNSTGNRYLHIVSTGTPTAGIEFVSATTDALGRSSAILQTRLAVGSTCVVNAYQSSGGSLSLAASAANSLTAAWLGA